MTSNPTTRLNKYISESGLCSRREADRYIEQGNVYINGQRATVGDQVLPGDTVKVNGQVIEPRSEEDLVFIALNKPVGIVSTTDSAEKASPTIVTTRKGLAEKEMIPSSAKASILRSGYFDSPAKRSARS